MFNLRNSGDVKPHIQDIQQKPANQKESNTLPKLLHHLQQSTNRVRKELNHINLLIKYKKEDFYGKNQKKLLNKYRKKLGNITLRFFEYNSAILKKELKSKSEKLKYQKKNSYNEKEPTGFCKQILRKSFDCSKKI